jgi:hypothetical protein
MAFPSTTGAIGTGINSPSALLVGTLDSLTQKKIAPFLSDIVLKPSPTYWALQRSGKHVTGGELVFPLLTQEENTGGAFWGDQILNTAVIDSIQPANQVWRAYYQNISIPTLDIILGSGGASAIDVVKAKMQVGAASLLPKLARAAWGQAPNNTSIDVDSIPTWISTTGTVAGINRASITSWQSAPAVGTAGGPLTVVNAEKAYQSVVFGYDEPDTMVLQNYDYGQFKTQFTAVTSTSTSLIRMVDTFPDRETVQGSIRYHFRFNNCIVLADQYTNPTGVAYMWNSKYMWMNYHSRGYFIVRPWIMASNQEVVTTRAVVVCQLTNVNPRTSVTITGLS